MKNKKHIFSKEGDVLKKITGDYLRQLFDSDDVKDRMEMLADIHSKTGEMPLVFEIYQPAFGSDDVYFSPVSLPFMRREDAIKYATKFQLDALLVLKAKAEGFSRAPGLFIAGISTSASGENENPVICYMSRLENRSGCSLDTRPIQAAYSIGRKYP